MQKKRELYDIKNIYVIRVPKEERQKGQKQHL